MPLTSFPSTRSITKIKFKHVVTYPKSKKPVHRINFWQTRSKANELICEKTMVFGKICSGYFLPSCMMSRRQLVEAIPRISSRSSKNLSDPSFSSVINFSVVLSNDLCEEVYTKYKHIHLIPKWRPET